MDDRRQDGVLNAITVDVEDWLQSVVDPTLPLTDRFQANTHKVLEALARRNTRATFFVLGLAAEQAPHLVRQIVAAGHEVQSHGYGHVLIHRQTRAEFRADVERSRKLLEDISGQAVFGYRAPGFSITARTLWALDVLVESGFRYDSSIFPVRMPRYGIAGAPYYPHRLRTPGGAEIIELPVASWRVGWRRVPTGGGGYFRLWPYCVLRRGVRELNRAGHPAVVYMHPYEYSAAEIGQLGRPISWRTRLHQGPGRHGFPRKVDRLLGEFRFGMLREVIASATDWAAHGHRFPVR